MATECECADVMANSLELLKLTMPCKTIAINNKPYLNRFFISQDDKGTQEWLHEYVCADSEPHLHSHPWKAISTVLSGGYIEERIGEDGAKKSRFCGLGAVNMIEAKSTHCITKVFPFTWTLMRVDAQRKPNQIITGNQTPQPRCSADWWQTARTLNGERPIIFFPLQEHKREVQIVATTISHHIEAPPCYI